MKTIKNLKFAALAAVGLTLAILSALGQAPVISSFGQNGQLVCTYLQPGSTASVEWASSVLGPWTNNWAGLESVTVGSNGMIQASVPMFYRVRGTPPTPLGMALIPAGLFTMGDTFNEGDSIELPLHTVYVSAFYLDKTEVTKGLWDEVYQWAVNRPDELRYSFDHAGLGKAANHPVQTVNWYDMVKWCNARSEKEGRVPAYYCDAAQTTVYRTGQVDVQNDWVKWNVGYRLPTEAEWEKAARGGANGHRFPWSDVDTITQSQANYNSSTNDVFPNYAYDVNPTHGYHPTFNDGGDPTYGCYTSPVGYFAANGYGLYDMAGNVWEWCWDRYGAYSSSPQTDPRGPTSGSTRVMRGGSWWNAARGSRVSRRYDYWPGDGYAIFGFRTALPLPPGQ